MQNKVFLDLYDNFGNKLSAMQTSNDTLKDISNKKILDLHLFKKFSNFFDVHLNELAMDIKDLFWASKQKIVL